MMRAEITGIAEIDGETVDHETVEISSESVIRSDGPIVIDLDPSDPEQ
jgi:hypothetical protein